MCSFIWLAFGTPKITRDRGRPHACLCYSLMTL
jgi:hypothetical protein